MSHSARMTLWQLAGWFALALLLAQASQSAEWAKAATPPCPEGSTPVELVELTTFTLPGDVPAGASVVLSRITLSPGEVLRPETGGYTAYFVESGLLKFQLPPRQKGFHLEHPSQCVSPSGEFSSGGTISIDDEGWMHIDAGTALISQEIPIERIGNAGNNALELLQVTLRFPEIDPATGEPLGDQLVTDGGRKSKKERQEPLTATPVP